MSISRRTVLGAGAALPVVLADAAHGAPLAAGPSPADWRELDRSITGSISLPGSSAYASRRKLFDPHWDFRRPAAVARVLHTRDVATCVTFAREHGLKVTGRSGGHSYTGASAATGSLVVDTRSLDAVRLTADRSEATVWAGADLYSVHEELAKGDRSVPTGTCPTVGAAGLSLVGGLGVDSRRYGLMADRLVSATVVDGRGRVLTVDADSEPDLFWALRGGGPGVGLVTNLTYETIPARSMGFFNVTYPGSSAPSVLEDWSLWLADQPRDTWSNAHVDISGSSLSVRIFGVTPVGKEDARAASLRSAVRATASRTTTTTRDFMGGIEYLGGGTTTPRTSFVAGSDILQTVTTGAGGAIAEAMRSASSRGLAAAAILDPLDGALGSLAADATPFPWRDHAASIQWYVGMSSSTSYQAARTWLQEAHDQLGSRSRGGYLGYVESGTHLTRYLGDNTTRISAARRTYDPDGVIA